MLRAANNTRAVRSSDNVQLKLAQVGRNLNCGDRTKVIPNAIFFQINKILPECMGIVILIACGTGTIFFHVF